MEEEDKQTQEEIIEEPDPWYKGPIKYIILVFLLLIIILWVPSYYVKLDPSPSRIPSISEVLLSNVVLENKTIKIEKQGDYAAMINPSDPVIKQTADKISTIACDGDKICQSKAIYYFVRDNIEYVADPLGFEYVEEPKEVLVTNAGDCESGAILMASMLEAIGIRTELVFIPSHAFVRAKIDGVSKRYNIGDWVYLEERMRVASSRAESYRRIAWELR